MKTYTCTAFKGFFPVGTAAIIVATNRRHARRLLEKAITERGLENKELSLDDFVRVDTTKSQATILLDGDY